MKSVSRHGHDNSFLDIDAVDGDVLIALSLNPAIKILDTEFYTTNHKKMCGFSYTAARPDRNASLR